MIPTPFAQRYSPRGAEVELTFDLNKLLTSDSKAKQSRMEPQRKEGWKKRQEEKRKLLLENSAGRFSS